MITARWASSVDVDHLGAGLAPLCYPAIICHLFPFPEVSMRYCTSLICVIATSNSGAALR